MDRRTGTRDEEHVASLRGVTWYLGWLVLEAGQKKTSVIESAFFYCQKKFWFFKFITQELRKLRCYKL